MVKTSVSLFLALSLKAEGKVAEEDNRLGDAVNSYLDTIRFG